jgi:hypothetical protein
VKITWYKKLIIIGNNHVRVLHIFVLIYTMLSFDMNQIETFLLITGIAVSSFSSIAQTKNDKSAYHKTIEGRAQKIVQKLNLSDTSVANKVSALVAGHYEGLNEIYIQRDSARLSPALVDSAVNKLHHNFLQQLSVDLSPAQIVQVKDGLTYGVLPVTYTAYLDMLPQLTAPQKKQIMIWLVEAREKAMDAESSEKKHGWFKKYKGRINNYLSAAGIDMKKEGEAWQERIKARSAKQ